MVCSRVLVVLMLSVAVRVQAEDVLYRGMAGDGTYNEVRQSQAAIPGGAQKSITTFSSRVLGGSSPLSSSNLGAAPENRMLGGLDNMGLLSQPLSALSPQLNLGLLGGQSPAGLNTGLLPSLSQLGQPGFSQLGQPGFSQLGQPGLSQLGQIGLPQLNQLGLSQLGQPGLSQLGQIGLPQLGQPGLSQLNQPGLLQLPQFQQMQQPLSLLQQLQPQPYQDQPIFRGGNNPAQNLIKGLL